ncbi:MAG: hypothetical protein DME60_14510 [Verrucomicrobia bacterium]|nr:MAG: hypothetical protein DME60_14510 [Verrucomicrobiota bacterium]
MRFLFPNFLACDARTLPGNARASRAVTGALAGNSRYANRSRAFTVSLNISTPGAARRGRRAEQARRVRSPIR